MLRGATPAISRSLGCVETEFAIRVRRLRGEGVHYADLVTVLALRDELEQWELRLADQRREG